MLTSDNGHFTKSVTRAADVLVALSQEPGEHGVSAIARQVGVGKSTVFRVLQSLRRSGFVAYDPENQLYRLGGELLILGLKVQHRLPIRHESQPALHELRDLTGESATLYLSVGTQSLAIAQVISHQEPKRIPNIGDPFPLHWGAVGRVLLAYHSDDFIAAYLNDLARSSGTGHSHWDNASARLSDWGRPENGSAIARQDISTLAQQLERVRLEGFAVSIGEFTPQTNGLAFPLLNARSQLVAAISIAGPADRWTRSRIDESLSGCREIVESLSLQIRYMDPIALAG